MIANLLQSIKPIDNLSQNAKCDSVTPFSFCYKYCKMSRLNFMAFERYFIDILYDF